MGPWWQDDRALYDGPDDGSEGASKVGPGTRVWCFTHLLAGARVGAGCNIGQGCFLDRRAVVGNHCKLQNNVSIYSDVTLEDYVFCGPSCVFTNVVNPRAEIERKEEFKPTLVRRGASIGANATVVCGVTIGRYAFVGAGAVVTHDVPDYALVLGSPARQWGWCTRHGAMLRMVLDAEGPGLGPGLHPRWDPPELLCALSGWRYELTGRLPDRLAPCWPLRDGVGLRCLDWPEEARLETDAAHR
jgi:UDP-2-acetamido-3-amino-2,3-dideoxy-glucuronate N-acetyltransferase